MDSEYGWNLTEIVVGVIIGLVLSMIVTVNVIGYIEDARVAKEVRELEEVKQRMLLGDEGNLEHVEVEELSERVREVLGYHEENGTSLEGLVFKNEVLSVGNKEYVGGLEVRKGNKGKLADGLIDVRKTTVSKEDFYMLSKKSEMRELPEKEEFDVYMDEEVLDEHGNMDVTGSGFSWHRLTSKTMDYDGRTGIHHIGSGGDYGALLYKLQESTEASTIEVEVKNLENDGFIGFNGLLGLRMGDYGATVSFYPNKTVIRGDIHTLVDEVEVDNTEFHTYRLVLDKDKGMLSVDGEVKSEFQVEVGSGHGLNEISIGDGTSRGGNKMDFYFKDLKFSEGKALN